MNFDPVLFLYALVAASAITIYSARRRTSSVRTKERLALSIADGTHEPVSLHPVINLPTCIGCGACVRACPEGDILGIMHGKAYLVDASNCIGHGACKASCPTDSIALVFGTEKRGVDIPAVAPDFQTNVPGIFIAGELGGMGLIRNAIEQGRQAIDEIAKLRSGKSGLLDVLIVGAGPAGFSASLAAMKAKMNAITLEQDSLGGTVAHYARGKLVMTAPAELPLVGKVKFGETSKENLLRFWQKVERDTGVRINYNERLEAIEKMAGGGFTVKTSRSAYRTRAILLAIGRRGTPRTLGVPGEDLSKVVYRMIEPEQYSGRRVLVVGGGDSAVEAAVAISQQPGSSVTLACRGATLSGAKAKNRQNLNEAVRANRLNVLMEANVKAIKPEAVTLQHGTQLGDLPNDDVIICAGGVLPTPFLKDLGVAVETKYGTA